MLDYKIICDNETGSGIKQTILENVVIKSDDNSESLYIDGTGDSGSPVYIGITKSNGNQDFKQPLEAGDIIGGLQIYSRVEPGNSLGYNHNQTPLTGSAIFKLSNQDSKSSEFLLAVSKNSYPTVRLVLDCDGNLKISGNISSGNLTITDIVVNAEKYIETFVKAIYNDKEYAIPLYSIQEK